MSAVETFILFYSEQCGYSKQIIDELDRRGVRNLVPMVSIEQVRAMNKMLPPEVTYVPAIMVKDHMQKQFFFGQKVFDFLFSLNTGRVSRLAAGRSGGMAGPSGTNTRNGSDAPSATDGPIQPFGVSTAYGDNFTFINEPITTQQSYAFSTLDGSDISPMSFTEMPGANGEAPRPMNKDTKPKRDLPDIEALRKQRQEEESIYMSGKPSMPPRHIANI